MTRRTRDRLGVVPAMLVIGLLGSALWRTTSLAQTPGGGPIDQNKLRLRKVVDTGTGNERMLFRGIFDVDAAAVLDPVSTGLQFQMLDSAAGALLDVTLPGVPFDVGGDGVGGQRRARG